MVKGNYFKSFDDIKIWYKFHKSKKETLVFLHGLSGNASAWLPAFKFFSKRGYSVIITDLRSQGLSGKPKNNINVESATKDLFCLLEKLEIRKIILVGHCGGGIVAQKFCGLYPEKVKKLILISSTDSFKKHPFLYIKGLSGAFFAFLLLPFFKLFKLEKNSGWIDYKYYRGTADLCLPRIFKDLRIMHLIPFLRFYWDCIQFNNTENLKKIKVPSLIIHGGKDTFIPTKVAYDLNRRISGSELIVIKGQGHIPLVNNPEKINRILLHFIEKTTLLGWPKSKTA